MTYDLFWQTIEKLSQLKQEGKLEEANRIVESILDNNVSAELAEGVVGSKLKDFMYSFFKARPLMVLSNLTNTDHVVYKFKRGIIKHEITVEHGSNQYTVGKSPFMTKILTLAVTHAAKFISKGYMEV